MFADCCLLYVVDCELVVGCCLLLYANVCCSVCVVACCVLFVRLMLMSVVCCLLFVADCCLLRVVNGSLLIFVVCVAVRGCIAVGWWLGVGCCVLFVDRCFVLLCACAVVW